MAAGEAIQYNITMIMDETMDDAVVEAPEEVVAATEGEEVASEEAAPEADEAAA